MVSSSNSNENDLDSFNEINSQDDALTREQKEKQANSGGVKNIASNLVNKANLLIKTTGQALTMSKAKSSPNAANLLSPDTFKDPSLLGAIEAQTPTNNDPDKMSEDEEKRIMRMIEDEDSSDDDDDGSENDQGSNNEAA